MEGVTAAQPFNAENRSAPCAITLYGFKKVL